MQEWEEELDTENMLEWWENDIHEEDYEDYNDELSQPTQSAGDLWRSQRDMICMKLICILHAVQPW